MKKFIEDYLNNPKESKNYIENIIKNIYKYL